MTTINLEYPITHNGQTIKAVSLRRPTVGDRLAIDKGQASEAEKEILFFANLSEQPPDVIKLMDLKDYQKLQEGFGAFLT